MPAQTTFNAVTGDLNAAVSNPVTITQSFAAIGTSDGLNSGTVSTSYSAKLIAPAAVTIGRDASGGYAITVPVETISGAVLSSVVRTLQFAANTGYVDPSQPALTRFAARQDASSTAGGGDRLLDIGISQRLSYVKFAAIELCNTASGKDCGPIWNARSPARVTLAFGTLTPLAEIPLAGSATFAGSFALEDNFRSQLGGDLSFSVDFVSHAITGTLTNVGYFDPWCDIGTCSASFANLTMAGQVAPDGSLAGTITPPDTKVYAGGTWNGAFFGPGATEVAGGMLINRADPGQPIFAGVFGAKKQ